MDINKILTLLETTSDAKLRTASREFAPVRVSATESANDILNKELGILEDKSSQPKFKKVAKESCAKRGAKESPEDVIVPAPFNKYYDVACDFDDTDTFTVKDLNDPDYTQLAMLKAKPEYLDIFNQYGIEFPALVTDGDQTTLAIVEGGGQYADGADIDTFGEERILDILAEADESSADESTLCKTKKAEESTIETPEIAFPAEFEFDEQAFADEYGIDVEAITAIYVSESEDKKEPEHIEIAFDFDSSKVVLNVAADGSITETVDGEFIEPAQFIGTFDAVEAEDGSVIDVLTLDLVEDSEPVDDIVKSEEDDLTKSERDEDHINEEGNEITDEFIEDAGLKNDEYYAKGHSMDVVKNPANRIDPKLGTARANESLAAKAIKSLNH